MVRLNITMPDELAKELDKVSNKSQYIAQALREKLTREHKQKLQALLVEGYKNLKEEDKDLNGDWNKPAIKDWD